MNDFSVVNKYVFYVWILTCAMPDNAEWYIEYDGCYLDFLPFILSLKLVDFWFSSKVSTSSCAFYLAYLMTLIVQPF